MTGEWDRSAGAAGGAAQRWRTGAIEAVGPEAVEQAGPRQLQGGEAALLQLAGHCRRGHAAYVGSELDGRWIGLELA